MEAKEETKALSSCPFCGEPAHVSEKTEHVVRCVNFASCAATPKVASADKDVAVAMWESRGKQLADSYKPRCEAHRTDSQVPIWGGYWAVCGVCKTGATHFNP